MSMNHAVTTMPTQPTETNGEPSVTAALEHVIEAGQRVIADRIDLVRLDTSEVLVHTLDAAAILVAGGILLCGAWFVAMAMLVVGLQPYAALELRLGLVMILNAV